MDYQLLYVKGNYSDKKRMKGIYRFVKRVYRNVIERNHRRSLLESYGKESIGLDMKREDSWLVKSCCKKMEKEIIN